MAKDRAQNDDIRVLLSSSVAATVLLVQDEHNSSRSHTQTSEAQLKRINNSIQATAEDHEILIRQQMHKDPVSVSSTSSLSSLDDDGETGVERHSSRADGNSRASVEDGDDKDKNHFDPESSSKFGRLQPGDGNRESFNDDENKESSSNGTHCLHNASVIDEEAEAAARIVA